MFFKLKTDSLFWFWKWIQFLYLQGNTGWEEPCICLHCYISVLFIYSSEPGRLEIIYIFFEEANTHPVSTLTLFSLDGTQFLLETVYDSKQENTIFMLLIMSAVFKQMCTINTILKLYIWTNILAISLLQHLWVGVDNVLHKEFSQNIIHIYLKLLLSRTVTFEITFLYTGNKVGKEEKQSH